MTNPLLIIAVALFAGVVGLLALIAGQLYAVLGLFLSLLLLIVHVRQGGVAAAFGAFKRGDLDAVKRDIRFTWWPRLLSKRNQAYQHWMEGVLLAAECQFSLAREQLLMASSGEIQTENDRSLIQCLLAEVAMQLDDCIAARDHLALARRLQHHEQVDRMIAAGEARLQARKTGRDKAVHDDAALSPQRSMH